MEISTYALEYIIPYLYNLFYLTIGLDLSANMQNGTSFLHAKGNDIFDHMLHTGKWSSQYSRSILHVIIGLRHKYFWGNMNFHFASYLPTEITQLLKSILGIHKVLTGQSRVVSINSHWHLHLKHPRSTCRQQVETLSASLVLYKRNRLITGGFPSQRPSDAGLRLLLLYLSGSLSILLLPMSFSSSSLLL